MTLILYLPLEAQENNVTEKKNNIVVNADGSKTITIYSFNENGEPIKTVTTIKVTEFADGTKIVTKNIKIFDMKTKEETLLTSAFKTYTIRPRRYGRNYKNIKTNDSTSLGGVGANSISPDGR